MVHTTEMSTTISLGNASWRKVRWLGKNLYLTIPWLVSPINLGPTGPGDHSQRPDPPGTAWAVGNRKLPTSSDITEGTMKNCDMVYNDWDKWYKHVSNILAFYTIFEWHGMIIVHYDNDYLLWIHDWKFQESSPAQGVVCRRTWWCIRHVAKQSCHQGLDCHDSRPRKWSCIQCRGTWCGTWCTLMATQANYTKTFYKVWSCLGHVAY